MAFGTIGFLPGGSNINRMPEFEIVPDICVFHTSFSPLANNIMTKITILRYHASISCFKSIVVTSETSVRFKMPDMFGIMIIGNFHFWESILAEDRLKSNY